MIALSVQSTAITVLVVLAIVCLIVWLARGRRL